MKNLEINQRRGIATPRGVGVMCDFYVAKAENATLWDVEGRQFTDFAAGIAVLNTGHRHPRVVAAITGQLDSFTHSCYQVVPYESYVALAERINAMAPIGGLKKTAFFSTGAEAVENTIKIARAYTRRPAVIAFSGAFHGRTMMGLALTGKVTPYKSGFGPFPSEVYHVPFPCSAQGVTVESSLAAIETLFRTDVEPERVAAMIIEPVQGEGGFHVTPPEFMKALRALCDRHGILLVADEVQTGFGRTGKLFAMEHFGVEPDLMAIAKSLGGGMPLSGVVGRAEIMDAPAPGGLGSTYAGNPLAVAAAHAVLDVIEAEHLCERSAVLGRHIMAHLQAERARCPAIAEVRGLGSMVAVEFVDPDTGRPNPEYASSVQERALDQGLILLTCGVHANVIRFLYPLTIPQAQFEAALQTLSRSMRA
ncbi:MAG: 4-aminobutyrate--2-oxoglutarate transaminase [Betaproteobacteria bacterium]|nr:4-aminobutyrate--2-oxoglutarate transaminase [Betaproteobacteria bacterium]